MPIRLILVMLLSSSSSALADDAKQVFDSLYGPRIKAAKATADRADDHALAKELLASAGNSADTPALLALLCEASYDLGSRHPDGFTTAAQAMTLLAESVEAQRTGAREKLADVLMKQSRLGKPDERETAGEQLIDTLLAMGDEKLEMKKWTEATGDYRRAMTIATPRKSPKLETIKAKLDLATRRDRAEKQIARLNEKLLGDANDSATAQEIVKLYIVEFDDPKAALPFLNRTKDESLKKLVPLASGATESVSGDDHLALGEWYRSLAGPSPKASELPLLKRARDAFARAMASAELSAAAQGKTRLLLDDTDRMSRKLHDEAHAGMAASPAVEQWISKDATYVASSSFKHWKQLPALLNGDPRLNMNEFAVHTGFEKGQYIVIDLGKEKNITKIWIENRRNAQFRNRAATIEVWLSSRSDNRGVKVWAADKAETEWTIPIRRTKARYITIAQPENVAEPLCLAQVRIFGPE